MHRMKHLQNFLMLAWAAETGLGGLGGLALFSPLPLAVWNVNGRERIPSGKLT